LRDEAARRSSDGTDADFAFVFEAGGAGGDAECLGGEDLGFCKTLRFGTPTFPLGVPLVVGCCGFRTDGCKELAGRDWRRLAVVQAVGDFVCGGDGDDGCLGEADAGFFLELRVGEPPFSLGVAGGCFPGRGVGGWCGERAGRDWRRLIVFEACAFVSDDNDADCLGGVDAGFCRDPCVGPPTFPVDVLGR
jgi:hypothetical protein